MMGESENPIKRVGINQQTPNIMNIVDMLLAMLGDLPIVGDLLAAILGLLGGL